MTGIQWTATHNSREFDLDMFIDLLCYFAQNNSIVEFKVFVVGIVMSRKIINVSFFMTVQNLDTKTEAH